MVWYGMVRYKKSGTVLYGMEWNIMVWYGIELVAWKISMVAIKYIRKLYYTYNILIMR